ncbi:hypothetical protein [Piscinibacter sp. XHJ-5]|uniref:hypothetical protein n=1 Tax=Piscinibacter sp. XHJ-5 TaxID=3037797 RepID=UPI002452A09D|nr:hypothetical protein [Piscinibacter sp. XHJ-5]
MTRVLPHPREAGQLQRLRTLRVERARERCGQAHADVERAAQAVRERQRRIERHQQEIEALSRAIVHQLAPRLPRWAGVAGAQKDHLAERLEREEYALVNDEHDLEQAQERLQQARAELTRALAREDAVRGLVHDSRRAHRQAREQRAERELEDQGGGPARSAR